MQSHRRGGYFTMLAHLGNKLLQDIKIRFTKNRRKNSNNNNSHSSINRLDMDRRESISLHNKLIHLKWYIDLPGIKDDIVSDSHCTIALRSWLLWARHFDTFGFGYANFCDTLWHNGWFLMFRINHKMNWKDNVKIWEENRYFARKGGPEKCCKVENDLNQKHTESNERKNQ